MPRDLKEPDGCSSSSLRKTRQLAESDRALDSMSGVSIQGLSAGGGAHEPIGRWLAFGSGIKLKTSNYASCSYNL